MAEVHGGPGGPWTTIRSAHPKPIQIGNLDDKSPCALLHSFYVSATLRSPPQSDPAAGGTLLNSDLSFYCDTVAASDSEPATGQGRAPNDESTSRRAAHVSALQDYSKSSFDYPICLAMF